MGAMNWTTDAPTDRWTNVRQVLRPLRVDDLDDLMRVQEEGAIAGLGHIFPQAEHPFPSETVRARWEQEIADPSIDCFAIVDETDRLAGFAATHADQFLHFGTALNTWGTGLAGQAHDEVVAHFISQGHPSAWMRVFEANERARKFYEQRGWVPTGQSSQTAFPPHPVLLTYRRTFETAPTIPK